MTRFDEIKDRVKAATGGPWILHFRADEKTKTQYSWSIWDEEGNKFILDMERKQQPPSDEWVERRTLDFNFIAHARQDIPDLIAEIERLRGDIKNIATQKTTEELKAEGGLEYEDADFEGAYDAIIHIARRTLEPPTQGDQTP